MNPRIYRTITDRFLHPLQAGTIPWRRNWTNGLPRSSSGEEFRDMNILTLGFTDHTSPFWITPREIQRLGARVREGEVASTLIGWKWGHLGDIDRDTQEEGKTRVPRWFPYRREVFNFDQVEGVQALPIRLPADQRKRLKAAEHILHRMSHRPPIVHSVPETVHYTPSLDFVALPAKRRYNTPSEYYAALFRGLVHATGHPHRLDRFAAGTTRCCEPYSCEELVAELGAAFLCGLVGISNLPAEPPAARTLDGWAHALRSDPQLIFRAAANAQRAVDYIRGKALVDPNVP